MAHLSTALLGLGKVRVRGTMLPAADGLRMAGLKPIKLRAKEGLALINGTQVSTALALAGLFGAEDVFAAAVIAGAMSVDALKGSDSPFDERIQQLRGQPGQIAVAREYRELIAGSAIRASHLDCTRVQDPYSFRCQPQVMGACLDLIRNCADTLRLEANAVTDNPLLFVEGGDVLSGGNFHAEPVAFAADTLALAIAEIGSLSERRTAVLVDPKMSGLPAFPGGEQRTQFRLHDCAGDGRGPGVGEQDHGGARAASIRSRPPPIRRIMSAWRRMPHGACVPWWTMRRRWSASNCWRRHRASIFIGRRNRRRTLEEVHAAIRKRSAVLRRRSLFCAGYRGGGFLGIICAVRSKGGAAAAFPYLR